MKKFIVNVFGKHDCRFCEILSKRLEIMERNEPELFEEFKIVKHNVMDIDGLCDFCRTMCINPNRIPAIVITDKDGNFIENPDWTHPMDYEEKWRGNNRGTFYGVCRLYHILGLQTDQDNIENGVISSDMIRGIMELAKNGKVIR